MSPEQELLNILFQGEMELAMRRIMNFELYNEAVRMYRDHTGWIIAHSVSDKAPSLYQYSEAREALDKFDFLANVIRLQMDREKCQKSSEPGSE
jgi:NADH:ubiquinone oxidoreductase subunit